MLGKLGSARVDLAGLAAQVRPGDKRFQDRRQNPLQMEGLENVREIRVRCSWKRLRARRRKARTSQPELDICARLRRRFPESRSQPNISGNKLLWIRV
jgi:hypothetical protein